MVNSLRNVREEEKNGPSKFEKTISLEESDEFESYV